MHKRGNKRLRSRSLPSRLWNAYKRTGRNPITLIKSNRRSQMNSAITLTNAISETQLSRQITPRTKNGHAPPITQS